MPEVRLQKALADAGVASRRRSEELIATGRVAIDGIVATLGTRVDPELQQITVDGTPIAGATPHVYLALHKPHGVTSTVADRHAAMTVIDLVPREILASAGRLYPVGRLDRDSEGLLLLTNDGDWAQQVLHPSHGVEREYAVAMPGALVPDQVDALRGGIELEEGTARLLALRPASRTETASLLDLLGAPLEPLAWYRVTLGQGWKRQVRRMFGAVGVPVARLVRVRIGTLRLGALAPGQVRRLTPSQVESLGSGQVGGLATERATVRAARSERASSDGSRAASGQARPSRERGTRR